MYVYFEDDFVGSLFDVGFCVTSSLNHAKLTNKPSCKIFGKINILYKLISKANRFH